MPANRFGQLISFSIVVDDDKPTVQNTWITLRKGDTVAKVAKRRGTPQLARAIADLNGIRSVRSVLTRPKLKVPGKPGKASRSKSESFDVLAGDSAPRIVGGYAKYDTLDRPQRVGLTMFTGFDPIQMEVPVRFESVIGGKGMNIEADIRVLERMAGRGDFKGAGVGAPPVIRVATTNGDRTVPLIPSNYQQSDQNPTAPLWRVAAIDWDAEPLRNRAGNRVRQLATVTLQQHVRVSLATRSATERARAKPKPKAKAKKR